MSDEQHTPGSLTSEEAVNYYGKIFAEAYGYYVPFHRGLSSPSADNLRAGIRAVLAALANREQSR